MNAFTRSIFVALNLGIFLAATLLPQLTSAQIHGACEGNDLVAELRITEPANYDELINRASQVPFGEGLFWKVTDPHGRESYVYGTIHLSEISVPLIPGNVLHAVRSSRVLATEIGGLADPDLLAEQTVLQMGKLFIGTGETLKSLLSVNDYEQLDILMADRGLPLISMIGFRPFVVMSLLGVPSCELTNMSSGGGVLDGAVDQRLAEVASEASVPNIGLESLGEQVDIITSVPLEQDVAFLTDFIRSGVAPDDMAKTLVELYAQERIDLLFVLMESDDIGGNGMQMPAQYRKALLSDRNQRMFERALPELEQGDAFIAVGALHLPGEDGVLALLQNAGFRVERISLD